MPGSKPATDPVLMIVALDDHGKAIRQGSGFVLTSDGLAGTNLHVLQGAHDAVAQCCNSRRFSIGPVQGLDADKDLVTFQLYDVETGLKPSGLPTITIDSSSSRVVGEKIVAIGSPQGLENTVSDGIVSAIREYQSVHYLQITAPISPGSSGGPVLEEDGKMIGVATMQYKTGQNLNFAVDANQLVPLLSEHLSISISQLSTKVDQADETPARREPTQLIPAETEAPTTPKSLTGTYVGEVQNITAGLHAKFGIVVTDSEGVLSGCMGVVAPLGGSGPVAGTVLGHDVSFDVISELGQITFVGTSEQDTITGTYTVLRSQGTPEEGSFTLQRKDRKGAGTKFDPGECPNDASMNSATEIK